MAIKYLRKAMYNLVKIIMVLITFPILFLIFPLSFQTGTWWLIALTYAGLNCVIIWQALCFVENIMKWRK